MSTLTDAQIHFAQVLGRALAQRWHDMAIARKENTDRNLPSREGEGEGSTARYLVTDFDRTNSRNSRPT